MLYWLLLPQLDLCLILDTIYVIAMMNYYIKFFWVLTAVAGYWDRLGLDRLCSEIYLYTANSFTAQLQ